MRNMGLNEIREKFLSFFESKEHLRMKSFSLVPENDPSILLINAGMTPLKPYFTGAEVPPAPRVTTCQKCIRTPDIERVGKTSRHGTYFEMLGNFSFGDYFKAEVIPWAWEFCTKVLEMPEDLLHVTVYLDDDEAYDIWHQQVGLPESKISRMGKEDNFWEHGTGPCGPCSEIFFDRGPDKGCGSADCKVGCDCDRFVEFWNLVFTQFNKEEDGTYTPLAKKNIDTGGGLERFACIMQDVDNLFEVDTIRAILDTVCEIAGVAYGQNEKTDIAIRVITDHIRSTTMMISDGILPSNEGRGYVLRRLLRRAARYGRLLGVTRPFLSDLAAIVIRESREAYPELSEKETYIRTVIRKEEDAFSRTVAQGSEILMGYIEEAIAHNRDQISGEDAFRLHDTYGFPLDLTREIAAESGLSIDEMAFAAAMKAQKEAARHARKARVGSAWGGRELPAELLADKDETIFVGYDEPACDATVRYLIQEDEEGGLQLVVEAFADSSVTLITDRTPFYAEGGGQVADTGTITAEGLSGDVLSVSRDASGKCLHQVKIKEGHLKAGQTITMAIDTERRMATARNHTATHLLQKALRTLIGDHVEQAGSLVTPDRFRFDFTHFQPLTARELAEVERFVNLAIMKDYPVTVRLMPVDEARKLGAMALFGEKYGETVRVVTVGDEQHPFSLELCGGTHLNRTSQALQLRVVSETGIAAGVRRIEAVTGLPAYELAISEKAILAQAAATLKTNEANVPARAAALVASLHEAEKKMSQMETAALGGKADALAAKAVMVGELKLVAVRTEAADPEQMRQLADQIRDRLPGSVILLAAEQNGKVALVAMADREAVKAGAHAGQLVKEAARITGGGGGGRPDMAQAGGKDPSKIEPALEAVHALLSQAVSKG